MSDLRVTYDGWLLLLIRRDDIIAFKGTMSGGREMLEVLPQIEVILTRKHLSVHIGDKCESDERPPVLLVDCDEASIGAWL